MKSGTNLASSIEDSLCFCQLLEALVYPGMTPVTFSTWGIQTTQIVWIFFFPVNCVVASLQFECFVVIPGTRVHTHTHTHTLVSSQLPGLGQIFLVVSRGMSEVFLNPCLHYTNSFGWQPIFMESVRLPILDIPGALAPFFTSLQGHEYRSSSSPVQQMSLGVLCSVYNSELHVAQSLG